MSQTLEQIVKSKVRKKKELDPNLQEKLIREEVLDKLGRIKDFYQITAKNVYWNRWRVNVWTCEWPEGMYGPSYNIKYSYFCTVQDNCIAKSDPEIIPKLL
tara:strand:- start:834 stop:1136 length:303 start_codon:yes stop_codon:yes gene_type:complete